MHRQGLVSLILAAGLILVGSAPEAMARAHHHHSHHARMHHADHHHHHHSKAKKIASIAAPIAIGAAFGPAGSVGYQVVKHRKAIKHHLTHHHG
ncbi:MAG: hypothetical protein ACJ74J_18760 [Blastocatellia bacterium]